MTVTRPALAIDGGPPVRKHLLPYGHQVIEEDDIAAVAATLRGDWLTTGPTVAAFEARFAAAVGARHAVAVANGTAALHAAAFVLGLGPGDEVVVPALTFAATANAVRYVGGTPIFADVSPDTLNVDPAGVEAVITPRTKAVFTVDLTGLPVDYDAFGELTARRNLAHVSDAAHALGARWNQQPVGALARLTTFSLHPVKHITSGEGGVVTTGDPELAARLRAFRNHGFSTDHHERSASGLWSSEMRELGFNYRLTDFQCALALSQLAKLPRWLERRREIARRYGLRLGDLPELQLPMVPPRTDPAWHLYLVRLELDRLRVGRREIFAALRAEGIGVSVHYLPVPWHPYYQSLGYGRGRWPVAEAEYERLLSLPMWAGMTDADVEDTINAVGKVIAAYRR